MQTSIQKIIIAIDPGLSGAMTVVRPNEITCHVWANESEFVECVRQIDSTRQSRRLPIIAYVEDVGGYIPDKEGNGQPGSRMFTFGRNTGFQIGVLRALDIPVIEIAPRFWQGKIAVGSGNKAARKKKLEQFAKHHFPEHAKTINLKNADAYGILKYAIDLETTKVAKGILHVNEKAGPIGPTVTTSIQTVKGMTSQGIVEIDARFQDALKPTFCHCGSEMGTGICRDGTSVTCKEMVECDGPPIVAKSGKPPVPATMLRRWTEPKRDSAHYTAVNALPYEQQARLCEDWAKAQRIPCPKRRTPEFSDLFGRWYNLAINGDA